MCSICLTSTLTIHSCPTRRISLNGEHWYHKRVKDCCVHIGWAASIKELGFAQKHQWKGGGLENNWCGEHLKQCGRQVASPSATLWYLLSKMRAFSVSEQMDNSFLQSWVLSQVFKLVLSCIFFPHSIGIDSRAYNSQVKDAGNKNNSVPGINQPNKQEKNV